MKKMLVLALALVFAGQAHAVEGRDKAKELKDKMARERIEREAGRNNQVNPRVKAVSDKIANSSLGRTMSGNESHDLESALGKDALLLKSAEEIVAVHTQKPALEALNKARLSALANIGRLSPAVRNIDADLALPEQKAEQSYVALVLSAGKQAANWPETTQRNMTKFLELVNEGIKNNRSVNDAMLDAKEVLSKAPYKVDIKIEDIRKLCKIIA